VRRDLMFEQELLVVRGEIARTPAAAFELHREVRGLWFRGVHDPEIDVVAVAAIRSIREELAVVRQDVRYVARFAVGQQRDLARRAIEAIDLKVLSAAGVAAEDDSVRIVGEKRSSAEPLLQKRELRPRPAGKLHEVQLRGLAESGPDQHLFELR